jgi:hypothetical protein
MEIDILLMDLVVPRCFVNRIWGPRGSKLFLKADFGVCFFLKAGFGGLFFFLKADFWGV